ncbi:MAG: hypothetical protein ABR949_10230 [Candidatus Aquilonibacter sp.]|jgi:hypothetical protein
MNHSDKLRAKGFERDPFADRWVDANGIDVTGFECIKYDWPYLDHLIDIRRENLHRGVSGPIVIGENCLHAGEHVAIHWVQTNLEKAALAILEDCKRQDVYCSRCDEHIEVENNVSFLAAYFKVLLGRATSAERAIRELHQWAERQNPPLDKQFDDIIGAAYEDAPV